jgi:predicted AAA+ superfamily ATPase
LYKRTLKLKELLAKKSFFLFGPRATGKSTLIKSSLPDAKVFDLLDRATFRRLLADPSLIGQGTGKGPIVIDEIQKIPSLLDEVHRQIESKRKTFLLTGSSARKLRRGAANLLAGRAWTAELMPLTSHEISDFDLNQYLTRGGLPVAYQSDHWLEELDAYVGNYLQDEILAESLTRNIEAFSEFLTIAAKSNGQEVNLQSFASDCGLSQNTIKNYFQILTDTLVGFALPAYTKTTQRKAITREKYYLFDIGVRNRICDIENISPKTDSFGGAFEHFIIMEVRAFNSYFRKRMSLNYWRSTSQFEVDLIIDGKVAVEIKGVNQVMDKHLKGIRALKEEGKIAEYFVVSLDPEIRVTSDGIKIYPWQNFLHDLWQDKLWQASG